MCVSARISFIFWMNEDGVWKVCESQTEDAVCYGVGWPSFTTNYGIPQRGFITSFTCNFSSSDISILSSGYSSGRTTRSPDRLWSFWRCLVSRSADRPFKDGVSLWNMLFVHILASPVSRMFCAMNNGGGFRLAFVDKQAVAAALYMYACAFVLSLPTHVRIDNRVS